MRGNTFPGSNRIDFIERMLVTAGVFRGRSGGVTQLACATGPGQLGSAGKGQNKLWCFARRSSLTW